MISYFTAFHKIQSQEKAAAEACRSATIEPSPLMSLSDGIERARFSAAVLLPTALPQWTGEDTDDE